MITVLKEEFIKEVCCGYSHTLAITMNGNVFLGEIMKVPNLDLGLNAQIMLESLN